MRRHPHQLGFSITELAIVVAVIGVLIGLLLPVIAGVRSRSQTTSTIAKMRSHAQVFTMYAADHRDLWPTVTHPTQDPTWIGSTGYQAELYYFDASYGWNLALADEYYGLPPTDPIFSGDRATPVWLFTDYLLSCSLMAAPAYWDTTTRTDDRSQWGPTRVDQVIYPSVKSIVVDSTRHPDYPLSADEDRIRLAMADASAGEHHGDDVERGYYRGDGQFDWSGGGHFTGSPRGSHTLDGVRGRDIVRN